MNLVENWFLWFLFYSIVGWVWEVIICSIPQKKFINRGFLNGPYCPIYGWGACLDVAILGGIQQWWLIFILSVLLTGVLEYATSYVMEKLFHARWWDYSNRKFNINGRVCLLGMVVFGVFSVLLLKLLHPAVAHVTSLIPPVAKHIIFAVAAAGFLADNIITFVGIGGLAKKAKALAESVKARYEQYAEESQQKAASAAALRDFARRNLNAQERRVLHAFPKLRSTFNKDMFARLRDALSKRKNAADEPADAENAQ